jgi:putative pyruvate formate lyase activating enzyme
VDIYMPDFKFWDPATAARLCRARDYPQRARAALLKMHGQVGDLVLNEAGEAERGMLIRHLVMPGGSGETEAILRFIATRLSRNSYVNIMSQYRPCGRAAEYPEINRSITDREFRDARRAARDLGLSRLDRPQRVFVWR